MSRTIKHKGTDTKFKMPRIEKGTKTTMRVQLKKEIDDDDYLDYCIVV